MTSTRFNGLTAVVTGGAQGIGLAVISRLIAEGARVASWDVLEQDNDTAMVEFGDRALSLQCDITNEVSVNNALATTEKEFGTVSILVNSAGITGPNVP
jgi:3-oxoacyl-[acyl-carrier protein] reductase